MSEIGPYARIVWDMRLRVSWSLAALNAAGLAVLMGAVVARPDTPPLLVLAAVEFFLGAFAGTLSWGSLTMWLAPEGSKHNPNANEMSYVFRVWSLALFFCGAAVVVAWLAVR